MKSSQVRPQAVALTIGAKAGSQHLRAGRFALACAAAAFVLAGSLGAALAQDNAGQPRTSTGYTPTVGQAGKDVVWVPTPDALVARMLDMADAKPGDILYDLGSGDGRTVIAAAKRGIQAKGIEYNPDLVQLATENAKKEGVSERATFVRGDIFQSDFSDATVVTLFLLPSLNTRLRPILLDMKPGTRVVSNTFDMGDWTPDNRVEAGGDCTSYCRAYFWVIPAKVQGEWTLPQGKLTLEQKYQMLSGTLTTANGAVPISDAKMNADTITFTAGGTVYTGKVNGNAMEGTAKSGTTETKFQGTRAAS